MMGSWYLSHAGRAEGQRPFSHKPRQPTLPRRKKENEIPWPAPFLDSEGTLVADFSADKFTIKGDLFNPKKRKP